ncbi:hypothetical protein BD410DRAFT_576545 [Rickenella mellea]|uniref:Amidohydrolase-related domain-containing protein n=1 Tax=Rickenella mellea TaxID=50990 RepID=A0A4Y7QF57_9AGAM|nr:hypothetical protein BD410DRAFT_576545 [Rickenella mellea]
MTDIMNPLPSPGVGARRKGPKTLPKLPLSAFSPPNTGTSDKFPLAPSPSTVHPEKVIDAHVTVRDGELSQWREETKSAIGVKAEGAVVSLQGLSLEEVEGAIQKLQSGSADTQIISILAPFPLENGVPANPPSFIGSNSKIPVHLLTTYSKPSVQHAEGIRWALQNGHVVDIEVEGTIPDGDAGWEGLEELVDKSIGPFEERKGSIVISNILPPPHTLELPIVKLLTHPTYKLYQSGIATLSLFPNVHVKFRPPMWAAATPSTPPPSLASTDSEARDSKEKKEWKRRIKMYLGPAVEAFGYQRILYGSAPSLTSQSKSNAGDWYELARESFTEIGLEQEDIDAVFCSNARSLYGRT